MDGIPMFGAEHFAVVMLCGLGAALAWRWGREASDRTARALAIGLVALIAPLEVGWAVFAHDVQATLPLHLCDLAWLVGAYALWTRSAPASAVLFYWGLTLSVQGILTPSLDRSFPDPAAVMFWGLHLMIVWAAVFQTARVGGPDWAGYRFTVLATLGWLVGVMTINGIVGTNYGYLNGKPETTSLFDLLGPWPTYVGVAVLLVLGLWALLTLPWTLGEEARQRQTVSD